MKATQNLALINAIDHVYSQSKGEKLSPKNLSSIRPSLRIVAQYLDVAHEQAFLFSLIVMDSYSGDTVNINDFCRHLDVNNSSIVKLFGSFIKLEQKGLIQAKTNRREADEIMTNKEFIVTPEVVNAIVQHEACPKIKKRRIETLLEAFGEIFSLNEQLDDSTISRAELETQMHDLIDDFQRFKFFHELKTIGLKINDYSILTYLIWKTLSGSTGVDIERILKNLYPAPHGRMAYMQELRNNQSSLVKHKLVELVPSRFLNDLELCVSTKLTSLLEENGIQLEKKKTERSNIIFPGDVGAKMLYYNPSELNQISAVRSIMDEANYASMLERLRSRNLPVSVNILLHGAPGTGKTESVLQLARESGREIMKVEISQTKSMWFGESEKIIKKVFTDYAEYAKGCKKVPVLFFNEADAVLGKRNEFGGASNARQTENTIQNILLEELENFQGIFIATTNLASNLDSAFERRFLFKVEFQQPSNEIRSLIWKDKLPFISEVDAMSLANQFELSGGQIENIVRKCEIDFVLHGENAGVEKLEVFCQDERLSNSQRVGRIGF